MKKSILYLLFSIIHFVLNAQTDSVWNLMIVKKGNVTIIKDTMFEYDKSGFNLYRNSYYDLEFKNNEIKTLKLIDIHLDTLTFYTIPKQENNITKYDTLVFNFKEIKSIILFKNFQRKSFKRIVSNEHDFIFFKSSTGNKINSKYKIIYSDRVEHEMNAYLLKKSALYCFVLNGKLYGNTYVFEKDNVQQTENNSPKYSDEEKIKFYNTMVIILNFIVNKELNIVFVKEKGKDKSKEKQ